MIRLLAAFCQPFVLRLARLPYVQRAMAERADLSAFKVRPTPRILCGVFLIVISFPLGWPAVAGMGALSLYFGTPWIAAIGGPLVYGLSHLVFLAGMYLSGVEYTALFCRWLARVTMERLLAWQRVERRR